MDGAVEQGDEADEGRLEAWRSMVGGSFRGSVVIKNQGRKSRPSQLIPGVGPTNSRMKRHLGLSS